MKNDRWLDARRFERERERHHENSARQASCFVSYIIEGAGEVIVNTAEAFQTPFFGEPAVAVGYELVTRPDLDAYHLPRISGGVFRWQREGGDRFVGMFPFFTVDIDAREGVSSLPSLDSVRIVAHMTFTGLSYKAMGNRVPSKLADAAIPARSVPYQP